MTTTKTKRFVPPSPRIQITVWQRSPKELKENPLLGFGCKSEVVIPLAKDDPRRYDKIKEVRALLDESLSTNASPTMRLSLDAGHDADTLKMPIVVTLPDGKGGKVHYTPQKDKEGRYGFWSDPTIRNLQKH